MIHFRGPDGARHEREEVFPTDRDARQALAAQLADRFTVEVYVAAVYDLARYERRVVAIRRRPHWAIVEHP